MNLLQLFSSGRDDRSAKATKHILISLICKGIGILCSLAIVPLTIDYVNPTQYGIWLTVSSVVGWIAFFDLGLANGFRNKYAEARARGDNRLAREYLSTTYVTLGIIALVLIAIILVINHFLDWPSILNVDTGMAIELRRIFAILSVFFCLNLAANVFSIFLTANQQPGFSAAINCLGQLLSLAVIIILTKTTEGSLFNLSIFFAGVPCIVMIVCSVIAFTVTGYRDFAPSFKMVRSVLVKDIIGKGIQFFAIYVCLILIFQISNIVLSREIGPLSVTQYNIAYKYFNVLYMVMTIIITPFWSAFTDAYVKSDTGWMKKTVRNLEIVWLMSVVAAALMLMLSSVFYKVWIKDSVTVPLALSIAMAIFVISRSIGDIYMYAINGIGTVRIQLILYVLFALVSWPCLVWSCRHFGVYGVVLFPSLVYFAQAAVGKIQLSLLISGRASGLWKK